MSAVLLTTPENFTYYDVMLVQLFKDMNCDIGGGGAVRESLAEYVASGSSSRKLGYFFLDVACKFNASCCGSWRGWARGRLTGCLGC